MATPVHNGLQIVPRGSAGAPSSGTWSAGTLNVDSNGVMYRCTVGGTPGTWVSFDDYVAADSAHVAAADPHIGYQKESEKGTVNGYVGLDASRRVSIGESVAATGFFSLKSRGGTSTDGLVLTHYTTTTDTTYLSSETPNGQDFALTVNSATARTITLPDRAKVMEGDSYLLSQIYALRNIGTALVTLTLNAADITAGLSVISIEGATSITIAPGDSIIFHLAPNTTSSKTANTWRIIAKYEAHRVLTNIEREGSIFRSILPAHATAFITLTGVAYFVYLGRTTSLQTPKFVEFHVSTGGAGAQTAEVGFFSTPAAPNKAAQSLTKIVATGTVDALTSTGVKRNTAAFATVVQPGVHLWAGIRTAMATTQPTILSLCHDMSQGHILSLAASGVLTGAGPFAGGLVAVSTAQVCPNLSGSLI